MWWQTICHFCPSPCHMCVSSSMLSPTLSLQRQLSFTDKHWAMSSELHSFTSPAGRLWGKDADKVQSNNLQVVVWEDVSPGHHLIMVPLHNPLWPSLALETSTLSHLAQKRSKDTYLLSFCLVLGTSKHQTLWLHGAGTVENSYWKDQVIYSYTKAFRCASASTLWSVAWLLLALMRKQQSAIERNAERERERERERRKEGGRIFCNSRDSLDKTDVRF